MVITFEQWNDMETKRIAEREGADVADIVRKARSGGVWRYMAYADYVEWCETNDFRPEGL